jgi:uncharacterized protein (TIGR03437 family)
MFTANNHGLAANAIQKLAIYGATGNWKPVNTTYSVTVIDANTFSIPVDATGFGALTGVLAGDYDNLPSGTGLEWQCVEFVRRYYLQIYQVPTDESNLGDASSWYDNAATPEHANLGLLRFQNGGTTAPQIGDILTSAGCLEPNCSAKEAADTHLGHVAIVSSVPSNLSVCAIMQNCQVCAVMQNWSEGLRDAAGTLAAGGHCMTMTISGSTYTVNGFNDHSPATDSYPIQGWLRNAGSMSGSSAPTIQDGGIVNAADYGPLSPGALASIYGTNLASSPTSAAGTPLPTTLAGISVTVNGILAPLLYVNQSQINFQVPWETAVGNPSVVVAANGVNSNAVAVPVLAAAPGLFITGGSPFIQQNQALVQNSNNRLNGPSNTAKAGSTIIAYLTGSGTVAPAATTGAVASSSPFSVVTLPYSAMIGEESATVAFAGLTPGLLGVTQMNIVVPRDLATGDYLLSVTVNGQTSNANTVSVVENGRPIDGYQY